MSVIIFLTVMNTLSDTLNTRNDLGFTPQASSTFINHLLYADDACIVSNSPAGCQHLLDLVQCWLAWAHLKAKVPKCRSLVLQASTGKRVSAEPSIAGQTIPPVEEGSFKFLGMPVRVTRRNNAARLSIKDNLQRMLGAIDEAPLTRQQKLHLSSLEFAPDLHGHCLWRICPLLG